MKKSLVYTLIGTAAWGIFMILGTSCGKRTDRMTVYGWELTGKPSDIILERLDSMVFNYSSPDSILNTAREYCRVSEGEDKEKRYDHRRLYWEGTAYFMNGEYEKGDSLRRLALQRCDSARFPHDYLVYRFSIEQPEDFPDNAARYSRYLSDLKEFVKYGDYADGFSRAVQLSQLMSAAGLHDRSLKYIMTGDSLLAISNFEIMRENNRANIASSLFNSGDTVAAVKTMKEMLSANENDASPVSAIVNFNIYQMNGDTVGLHNAWRIVEKTPELRKMRPLVAAALVKSGVYNTLNLSTNELRSYLEEEDEYSYLPEEEMYIKDAICEITAKQNPELFPEALKEYQTAVEKYFKELKKGEVVSSQIKTEIGEVESNAEKRHHETTVIFWIALSSVLIVAGAIVIILIMRINKLHQLELLTQIEVEQNKRKQLTLGLSNNVLEKSDASDNSESDNVALDVINPPVKETYAESVTITNEQIFISEFIKSYPKVGKTGRRLALNIWQGLDSVEIAKQMNIRKESVMQARWRLRRQMALQPEDDLELIILGFNKH